MGFDSVLHFFLVKAHFAFAFSYVYYCFLH
jgi:hypothetical protein